MGAVHCYGVLLEWEGSTGPGYDSYDRTHRVARYVRAGRPSWRAMMVRSTSEVPSPISRILASR